MRSATFWSVSVSLIGLHHNVGLEALDDIGVGMDDAVVEVEFGIFTFDACAGYVGDIVPGGAGHDLVGVEGMTADAAAGKRQLLAAHGIGLGQRGDDVAGSSVAGVATSVDVSVAGAVSVSVAAVSVHCAVIS